MRRISSSRRIIQIKNGEKNERKETQNTNKINESKAKNPFSIQLRRWPLPAAPRDAAPAAAGAAAVRLHLAGKLH